MIMMMVTILWTDVFFFSFIFSVFARFKLFVIYLYSIYKTLSNSAWKDQRWVQGAFPLCVCYQDPKRIVVIIGAYRLVVIKALDVKSLRSSVIAVKIIILKTLGRFVTLVKSLEGFVTFVKTLKGFVIIIKTFGYLKSSN